MTVSRLERPARRYFSEARALPYSSEIRLESRCLPFTSRVFNPTFSTGDFREIRDLTGGLADAGEQRQTVGTHGHILIIHENMLKE